MLPFKFAPNKDRILKEVEKRIKLAGIKDPKGFTLMEGIIVPVTAQVLDEITSMSGRLMPQVAIVGNSTGLVYYFYLDNLLPGEGLD